MRELTVQAGNTTLSSTDRQAIGEELVALRSEIDNIASRTRFNGLNLLNGSLAVTLDGASTATRRDLDGERRDGVRGQRRRGERGRELDVHAVERGRGADGVGDVVRLHPVRDLHGAGHGGERDPQAIIFENLGVTINLSHDANAGNVTGAGIAGD
jgi:hypothetical protein